MYDCLDIERYLKSVLTTYQFITEQTWFIIEFPFFRTLFWQYTLYAGCQSQNIDLKAALALVQTRCPVCTIF